jgi:hypothetical protein
MRQIARGNAVETAQPLMEATVIGVYVLHMHGAARAYAGAQVHGFMANAGLEREVAIHHVTIGDEQNIPVEHGRQAAMQLPLGHGAFAGHEIGGLAGAVTGHQNTYLLIGNAAFAGGSAALAGRSVHMARAFFGCQQEGFIGLGDPVQVLRRLIFDTSQKAMAPAKTGGTVNADDAGGLRMLMASSRQSRYSSQRERSRSRASGVPVRALNVLPQPRQR